MKIDIDEVMSLIADFSAVDLKLVNENSSAILEFAKSFEKLYPSLKNLKIIFTDEAKVF